MSALRQFTSESVTEGHPDKICDQISDSILDALLAEDPRSRVAVETLVTTGLVHVAGEVSTEAYVEIPAIVRERITSIGYDSSDVWFDGRSCGVSVSIGGQSPDIAQGVDDAFETREGSSHDELDRQGAGDQGIMFGYAVRETPELMPVPIWVAHRLAERLTEVRKTGELDYLRPDGKTQVTVGYEGQTARTIETVVLSTQHAPSVSTEQLRAEVEELVIRPVLDRVELVRPELNVLINPTGRFEIGGPQGDAGLTGRKVIIDTYGGASRHGGGAFSGKDPRRSTARRRTPCAGSRRTPSQRGWPTGSSCRSRTRSARRRRWACTSRRSAPVTCRRSASPRRSARCSTCVRPRSSATSTCCARSTPRRPPTGTSAVRSPTSPGSGSTASTTSARPPGSDVACGR
ncbi:hypothetical protein GCM10025870_00320 [Agromyces marinus]|uniref:Methionine adenosyltransferase n=1 Tax=Agromyces marinus TaxID=1389020 RepID=A0ABM8GWT9_9MICO|nr:hypothetical protein GCM10025870_00320 [Agromyces marinus]